MSYSSSTNNTIFNASEWEVGQSVVGAVNSYTLPSQSLATTSFLNNTQSLSSGIWAITATYTITSTAADTLLTNVIFQVVQPTKPTVYQEFYYNATLAADQEVNASFTTIVGANSNINPFTYGIILVYDTASTDVNISGVWNFIRIA